MTYLLIVALVFFTLALGFVSFVQLLYLESLRLRARELPALEYFKDELEERIGLKPEHGALAFSLIKHTLHVALGVTAVLVALRGQAPATANVIEGAVYGVALMLLASYAGPQLLYRRTNGRWLLAALPLLKPIALLLRPLKRDKPVEENGTSPEEDLEALIEAGADEGLIEEDDRELIHSVVALGDKTVREVMTARPNIASIQEDATIEDFRQLALANHFSRFPVFRESIDDIVGIVHVRDILQLEYEERAKRKAGEFVHPTHFVPETKPVADLFREMQKDNIHLAIVVDEYGETAGIATMEDVMEEVFGEIRDEYDPAADMKEEGDGIYVMHGNVDLDRLHEIVEFRPDDEMESTTVGGLVSEWLGHVAQAGEVVERDGIRLEVVEADERHVELVRVSRAADV